MADGLSGNRFAEITPDNHAGSIWIASLLCLIYSVLTLALRGHLRFRIYGMDDYMALAATVRQYAPSVARGLRLIQHAAHPGWRSDRGDDRTAPWTRKNPGSTPSK
jgi:hypothetical protein